MAPRQQLYQDTIRRQRPLVRSIRRWRRAAAAAGAAVWRWLRQLWGGCSGVAGGRVGASAGGQQAASAVAAGGFLLCYAVSGLTRLVHSRQRGTGHRGVSWKWAYLAAQRAGSRVRVVAGHSGPWW